MLTKDVLKLFQEAAGRKASVAEVNAVQTYALLMPLTSMQLHASSMIQVVQHDDELQTCWCTICCRGSALVD